MIQTPSTPLSAYFIVNFSSYLIVIHYAAHIRRPLRYIPSVCPASTVDSKTDNSPANAERPRDASCVSVSNFNSTIRRAQVPLQIYRCVQLDSVLFSSSWSSMLAVTNKITDTWRSVW